MDAKSNPTGAVAHPFTPEHIRQQIETVLAEKLTPTDIEQWWNSQWECTCSESHGTRREFFERNPMAVLIIAKMWADWFPFMDAQ